VNRAPGFHFDNGDEEDHDDGALILLSIQDNRCYRDCYLLIKSSSRKRASERDTKIDDCAR